jgi:predicted NBD/HSP70 family sugar kinase
MEPGAGAVERVGSAPRAGTRASVLRRHNLGAVLEHLHLGGSASRSQLALATGLNRSTVGVLVHELAGRGLVTEHGVSASSGPGRPSPIVHLQSDGAVALAIELGVESVAAAVIGLGGAVLDQRRVDLPGATVSPAAAVGLVEELAAGLVDPADSRLAGVGVAVPGLTRRSDGFVHVAPNLGWRGVGLGGMLADALGLPAASVRVGNEADLGALGEHRRGAGRGYDHVVFVSGEVGIGAGLIIGGRPMLGASGYAGEAGHMVVNPDGSQCRCGARGCWETEVGEAALLRSAGVHDLRGAAAVAEVLARADAGDPVAVAAVTEIGHWLGVGVSNLANLLDPEVVVLGGIFQQLFPFLQESMLEAVRARSIAEVPEPVLVLPSALGTSAQLHGAAEVVLGSMLADLTRG